jgi:tetratricopeptide (TPR) repeat protein
LCLVRLLIENYHPTACYGLFASQTVDALRTDSFGSDEAKIIRKKILAGSANYSREDTIKWAEALISMAVQLGELDLPLDAIATYDEVVRRFGDDPAPALREQVAKALVSKGITLGQQGQPLDAIATYNEIVRRFGDDPAPALRERVAKALFNKGVTLDQQGQPLAAIATYNEIVRRFGDDPAPALRERVAKALFNKGVTLNQQGQPLAAIATYDEVVRRFGDDPAPALREQVARVRNDIGFKRLIQAKTETSPEMRIKQWAMALDLFRTALEGCSGCSAEARAMVLGNVAYASVLLGNPTAGRTALQEALSLGGETLYNGTLDDLRQHPIPEDAPMHALLQACWAEQQAG